MVLNLYLYKKISSIFMHELIHALLRLHLRLAGLIFVTFWKRKKHTQIVQIGGRQVLQEKEKIYR